MCWYHNSRLVQMAKATPQDGGALAETDKLGPPLSLSADALSRLAAAVFAPSPSRAFACCWTAVVARLRLFCFKLGLISQ